MFRYLPQPGFEVVLLTTPLPPKSGSCFLEHSCLYSWVLLTPSWTPAPQHLCLTLDWLHSRLFWEHLYPDLPSLLFDPYLISDVQGFRKAIPDHCPHPHPLESLSPLITLLDFLQSLFVWFVCSFVCFPVWLPIECKVHETRDSVCPCCILNAPGT